MAVKTTTKRNGGGSVAAARRVLARLQKAHPDNTVLQAAIAASEEHFRRGGKPLTLEQVNREVKARRTG